MPPLRNGASIRKSSLFWNGVWGRRKGKCAREKCSTKTRASLSFMRKLQGKKVNSRNHVRSLQQPFKMKSMFGFVPRNWGKSQIYVVVQASNSSRDAYMPLIWWAKCEHNHFFCFHLYVSQWYNPEQVSLLALIAGFPVHNAKTTILSQLASEFWCMDITKLHAVLRN